jgi:hypothetical protein
MVEDVDAAERAAGVERLRDASGALVLMRDYGVGRPPGL